MPFLAGIDEVGYGPRLGPLVVSAALFEVPDRELNLWKALAPAVTHNPAKSPKVAVCDSKRLYVSPHLEPLERTALAFWKSRDGANESTFFEFLAAHASMAADALPRYPWYQAAHLSLPFADGAGSLDKPVAHLRKSLARAGTRLAGVRSSVADVVAYNDGIARLGNKSDFLFEVSSPLYRWLWDNAASPGPLDVTIGKQGGRTFYAPRLERLFPEAFVWSSTEQPDLSVYSIEGGGRKMRLSFAVDAEDRHFPVGLASIIAKYTREGLMTCFNRWWAGKIPGLRPTAGYHEDAGRFIRETDAVRKELGIEEAILVRRS